MSTLTQQEVAGSTQTRVSRGRAARIAVFAARAVLAAVFVNAAAAKLTLNPQAVAGFAHLGGVPMLIFVGLLEVSGAIGLIVPILSGFASIGTSALLAIITVVTSTLFGPAMGVMPAACLVLSVAIAYLQRHQTVRFAGWLGRTVTRAAR